MRRAIAKEESLTSKGREEREQHVRKLTRTASFTGKTFEQLKKDEKDALLKAVAVRLGLIEDSPDPS